MMWHHDGLTSFVAMIRWTDAEMFDEIQPSMDRDKRRLIEFKPTLSTSAIPTPQVLSP